MNPVNVFVLGLDERNLAIMEQLPEADGIRFHRLLTPEELLEADPLDLGACLEKARAVLDDFDGTVDAVIGYWDFPVSSMTAMLCRERGLPGPSLEGALKCEHKYWSRLEQASVAEDFVPAFAPVPLDPVPSTPPEDVPYPFWLKPLNAMSSRLAYRIDSEHEFRRAVAETDAEIDNFSRPFELVLGEADLPPRIAELGARACVAEGAAVGRQFTVEGYCVDDEVHIYGVVETVLYPGTSNFQRYEYPAAIPDEAVDRLEDGTARIMQRVGLGSSTFNIEFFWDEEHDRIRVLEINPRLSQAHAEIVELVDGVSNFRAMVALGLGRDPDMPHREGEYPVAGKFFPRVFSDGVVTSAPAAATIEQVKRDIPGVTSVAPAVDEGDRLADLPEQDPYSYGLGAIVIGGADSAQLRTRYHACLDALGLVVEEPAEGDDA